MLPVWNLLPKSLVMNTASTTKAPRRLAGFADASSWSSHSICTKGQTIPNQEHQTLKFLDIGECLYRASNVIKCVPFPEGWKPKACKTMSGIHCPRMGNPGGKTLLRRLMVGNLMVRWGLRRITDTKEERILQQQRMEGKILQLSNTLSTFRKRWHKGKLK